MTLGTAAALLGWLLTTAPAVSASSDLSGEVLFKGLPVPGALITVTQGERVVTTTSNVDGVFRFVGLDDGHWTLRVQMRGFTDATRDIILPQTEPLNTVLTMRPYDEIVPAGTSTAAPDTPHAANENDVDVINGSAINGAATPFAQPRAFGNNRPRPGATYQGLVNAVLGNSAWNARPFSFGGSDMPSPTSGDVQIGFTLGGPFRLPRLVRNGPQMLLRVQHGVTNNTTSLSAVVPTIAERQGDFSALSTPVRDPLTGLPFPNRAIPADRISQQAQALLGYYPLPNAASSNGANYETAARTRTTQDAVQFGLNSQAGRRTTIDGLFSFQRSAADSSGLFGFDDATRQATVTASGNWQRRLNTRSSARLRYQFTGSTNTLTPFFANRANVSGDAGIAGNSQQSADWGPPSLSFPDEAGLTDAEYQHTGSRTQSAGGDYLVRRGRHDLTLGGDAKRTAVDVDEQADPRGTLAFTGAATGVAFADFLLGIPTTSTIGFGNTGARLHGESYDAYVTDDWRLSGLTVNLGARWEYESPFIDAGRDLAGAIRPDWSGIEPRLATSWRPFAASSFVLRATYAVYRNLGVYQPLATLLIEQPPFARTFSVANTAASPLSLASPFPASLPSAKTFAVDPNFRVGSTQDWQLSAQRDLPASLTMIVSYLGTKGAHLMQASLPNSYPPGTENPCPSCPSSFVLVTSGGTSLRNAAEFTLRRRLRAGFTATATYTLSKSTDDAATFSNTALAASALTVAQNWLDLGAERGPSPFDQRHLLTAQVQYSSGVGVGGGTLIDGGWGALLKDWTLATQLTAGSGLPFTPVSFATVAGTGFVGIRPQLTGIPVLPAPPGAYANPAAYATPAPGAWGNAGRDSIRGPAQFGLDASVARVFRLRGKTSLEWNATATNVLNHVTFAAINTFVGSPQFGQPTLANPMRRILMTLRYRF